MEKVGIFFGSDGGNSKTVAENIAKELGDAEVIDVASASKDQFGTFKNLILVTPTYGSGDLQTDWEDFLDSLSESDFSGKVVGLVGLGDQDTYSDTFCDGISHIYNKAKGSATIVGQTSTDGYEFSDSQSVVDGKFVGLALDEDNQDDKTADRIKNWVADIKGKLA